MNALHLLFIALLTETLSEIIKDLLPYHTAKKISKYISVIVALFLSIGYKIDLFYIFNMEFQIPYVGYLFSGLICSRGANYVHNFLGHANIKSK